MQTRNQKFAAAVYEKVTAHKGKGKPDKDKYGAMAQKLPVLIRTAGLAQAIAFLEAKSKEKMNKQLLEDLAMSLGFQSKDSFVAECRNVKLTSYLQLTQNTLAALLWFKRFAVSVLEVEENAQSNQ